jgi:hypothetical protein
MLRHKIIKNNDTSLKKTPHSPSFNNSFSPSTYNNNNNNNNPLCSLDFGFPNTNYQAI